LIIGRSGNTEESLDFSSPHGIITPRSDNFVVDGARFYYLDFQGAAALGSCSHCFHGAATDSGARTVKFLNLEFDETVPRRIAYQTPWQAIYNDLDGSLTGLGPNSWATPDYTRHHVPECTVSLETHGGVICDSTSQVRRMAFYGATRTHIFDGMHMSVLLYDDEVLEAQSSIEDYLLDRS